MGSEIVDAFIDDSINPDAMACAALVVKASARAAAEEAISSAKREVGVDGDLSPRLRAPARLQHHAQDALDAEPRVPEAGVRFVHRHLPCVRASHTGATRSVHGQEFVSPPHLYL